MLHIIFNCKMKEVSVAYCNYLIDNYFNLFRSISLGEIQGITTAYCRRQEQYSNIDLVLPNGEKLQYVEKFVKCMEIST